MQHVFVFPNHYQDSAVLMRLARDLSALPGVADAVVLMGTPLNRSLLEQAGYGAEAALASAGPMDLIVALRTQVEQAKFLAEQLVEQRLRGDSTPVRCDRLSSQPQSLREAFLAQPEANLVSIAVPGTYAAWVARRALDAGRHVFLFSDNVPQEEELALKQQASAQGLLMMGPDCGTAVIAGVGLGFANRMSRGPVGLVGASGTGLQEIFSLLDAVGMGISHAIGTGSRDLSLAINGQMSEFALRLLADDPATKVIVLVAKHPDHQVAARVHAVLANLGKPVFVRYLGEAPLPWSTGSICYVDSLDTAAHAAALLSQGLGPETFDPFAATVMLAESLGPVSGRLVGLFGGGSLAAEAGYRLSQAGLQCQTLAAAWWPGQPLPQGAHLLIDVGDDAYTVGRPHPMIDQSVRCGLLQAAGAHPDVGLLLFDLVLGDGAHPDPAPELAAAVAAARSQRPEHSLTVVASVSGTRRDPQDLQRQRDVLTQAGIVVLPSAACAAALAACLLTGTVGPRRSA